MVFDVPCRYDAVVALITCERLWLKILKFSIAGYLNVRVIIIKLGAYGTMEAIYGDRGRVTLLTVCD